jgi:hypothetical protein
MPDDRAPQSAMVLYQTEDGRTRIQCRFENETIWLSQVQIAELFQTSVPNINLHLKAIYTEVELPEAATIKSYLIVRTEGARQVSREVLHYSLPAILAVGYRVRGHAVRVVALKALRTSTIHWQGVDDKRPESGKNIQNFSF